MNASEVSRARASDVSDTADRAPGRGRTNRQIGLVVAVTVVSLIASQIFGRRYTFFDMKIYHGAVEWWTSGGPLYECALADRGSVSPTRPSRAVSMLPMALTSAVAAGWINAIASVVALAWCSWCCCRRSPTGLDGLGGWRSGGVAAGDGDRAGRETIGFGQVNLLLFGLVMADMVALRWRADGPPRGPPVPSAGSGTRGPGPARV